MPEPLLYLKKRSNPQPLSLGLKVVVCTCSYSVALNDIQATSMRFDPFCNPSVSGRLLPSTKDRFGSVAVPF